MLRDDWKPVVLHGLRPQHDILTQRHAAPDACSDYVDRLGLWAVVPVDTNESIGMPILASKTSLR